MSMRTVATIVTLATSIGLAQAVSISGAALPTVKTHGAVTYLSGGVGQDEAAAVEKAAPFYPLELEFLAKAKPKDEYTADVQVTISDKAGNVVLDTKADGPFLLAKLPPGLYKVSATAEGKTKIRRVHIGATGHHHMIFEWATRNQTLGLASSPTHYRLGG